MFLEDLKTLAETTDQQTDVVFAEELARLRSCEDRRELSHLLRSNERAGAHMVLNCTDLSEDDLIDMLFCPSPYARHKSAEALTKMYEHKAHKKEYLPFFKQMLKESTSYEESNHLLRLLIDFLSCRSERAFSIEERKMELASNKIFLEILHTFVFIKEVQYNTLMIILVLSYSGESIKRMGLLINDTVVVIKEKTREKILRVCYAIIVNAFDQGHVFSPGRMNDIAKCTEMLLEGNYGDVEFLADLQDVRNRIVQVNSSFCIRSYLNELFSGRFEDSEYHHKEDFWTNNIEMLMKNKVEIVKVLKKYLRSNNPAWVCLACNDIFQLIKAAPEVNALLAKYQVKDALFGLIHSENDDIRFHAIQTLYMCIFSEWS